LSGVQALLTSMISCWREKTLSMGRRRMEPAAKRVEEETSRLSLGRIEVSSSAA